MMRTVVSTAPQDRPEPPAPIWHRMLGPQGAPVVVFTHGGWLDHRSWDPQVEAFGMKYRVLVWDLPNHGASVRWKSYSNQRAAEVLLAILDRLGVDQAIFVWPSVRGWVSQEVARMAPERVLGGSETRVRERRL
jgi:pimeloyl-ACP methyl ester carboxylesterase